MGKVSQIITGSLVSVLVLGGSVSALDGSISNTGPGSHNEITDDSDVRCEVTNDNDVDIDNNTDQTSSSGGAEVSGNTSGGNATSGSASNTNEFDLDVTIDNGSGVCLPEENAGPVTPPEGGRGGGQVGGVKTTQQVGGMGAGQQVVAPVGGVGAGSGGSVAGTFIASLAALAYGVLRLRRNAFTSRF